MRKRIVFFRRETILFRKGFLSWKGTQTQPDTILRGVFITRRIICQSLGDPPPAAQGATLGGQQTNRERVTALTGPGTCGANCHGTLINPAGFALENFGALGEFRTKDNEQPIDASSSYRFAEGLSSFSGAVEFSRVLANSRQVHACFSGYLFEYLFGREQTAGDAPIVAELVDRSVSGASARDQLAWLLETDLLRYPHATPEPH